MGIKDIINKYPKINIDQIKRIIDHYNIVSFDIFDTLIKRDVQSEHDVFDLTERLYNQNRDVKIQDYRSVRKRAEDNARVYTKKEEITVEELRMSLVGEKDEKGIRITDAMAGDLIDCERAIENKICVRNENIYPLYQYCIEKRKRILITSDMYWEKTFLEELLKNCEINNYSAIYVSSECGKQKRTGSLFGFVVEKENVQPKSILHIGDNKKSDFLAARKAGLRAISIPKTDDNTIYAKKVKENTLEWECCEKFISNRIKTIDKKNERIGYEVYGPLLYSFSRWLSERLDCNKTTLFFARDCYVVKPAFEQYTGVHSERNVYFLGSRRSLIIPALKDGADLARITTLIKSEARKMTVSDLLKKLGVDITEYGERLKKFGLLEDTILDRDNLFENKGFVDFYESIRGDIETNATEEYNAFVSYWASLNCTNELQVVDIGWRGTMQYCLENLVGKEYSIKGYYLGIRKDAIISAYEDIFLNGKEDFEKECFLAGMTSLIEIFFSAPHGSVKKYISDCKVEYLPYECAIEAESKELVEELHRGALQFERDYKDSVLSELAPIPYTLMFVTLFMMGTKPNNRELHNFGTFPFQMGAGIKKNIDSKGLLKYAFNPKKFLYDFSNSNWKVGFLKDTIRLNISCYPIFKWIYKHRG